MSSLLLVCSVLGSLSIAAWAGEESGRTIFEGKGGCLRCHSVANRGGSLGPDLSEIGVRRSPASLRLSIANPDAEILQGYLTAVLVTTDGRRIEGIAINEDDISIQLRDTEGNPRSFLKRNLKQVGREQRSLMPRYAERLSEKEIDSVVDYLRTLRGATDDVPASRRPAPLTVGTAWLTRPNRDAQERPEMLLDSLGIPAGAYVVDLGAGAGYFTWRLATRVGPTGKIIAVDIQPRMLDLIAHDVRKRNLSNVELRLGTDRDPRLPEGVADVVLIANAYHEFIAPQAMLAAVRKSLKRDGRLVVIEYAEEKGDEDPVAGLATMRLTDLRSEIEAAGFRLDLIVDFLPMQHGLVFTR
jgi:putative heme-binding domain-containing protein